MHWQYNIVVSQSTQDVVDFHRVPAMTDHDLQMAVSFTSAVNLKYKLQLGQVKLYSDMFQLTIDGSQVDSFFESLSVQINSTWSQTGKVYLGS